MSEFLIHAMAEFGELILGVLDLAGVHRVVEIGAEHGGMTQPLADFCARRHGELIVIEPTPTPEFAGWARAQPHVELISAPSLDVIDAMADIDAWLIDGDHNYYSVYFELIAADTLARRDGRPLLAIIHNVGWPCARRDMYRAPERIPAAYRQPFSHDVGITLGDPGHLDNRGFRGSGHYAWALESGGPCNGVLTAIEDFCRQAETGHRRLLYVHIPAVFGLGLLFDAAAPWAEAVAHEVMPFHDNPLLARLEANRLTNYLAVLDWQDGFTPRP